MSPGKTLTAEMGSPIGKPSSLLNPMACDQSGGYSTLLIFLKDVKEMAQNKTLFRSLLLFPILIAVGLPLLLIFSTKSEGVSAELLYEIVRQDANLYLKYQFMLIPIMMCAMIAGDSFAGEKERKTIESLCALPLKMRQIYVAKIFASVIPTLVYAAICFTIMGFEINCFFLKEIEGGNAWIIFGDPSFWALAFVLTPSLVFVLVQICVMISAHVSTAKGAQQLSMVFILPIIVIFLLGIERMRGSFMDPIFFLRISGILLGIGLVGAGFGGKSIKREKLMVC